MTPLKKYFEHLRDVETQRKERIQKKIEDCEMKLRLKEEKRVAAYEAEFLEYDFLLRRDLFDDENDILLLVWEVSEEAFQLIMKNLNAYSPRIQITLMYSFDPPKYAPPSAMKVRDISDLELYREQVAHVQSMLDKVDELWIQYKKNQGLSRPDGDVDAKYTELYESLQATKKQLDVETNKPSKTYVAPSMRKKQLNPEAEKLRGKITTLENEIVRIQKEIELQEQIWDHDKKSEVFNKLLYAVC